MKAGGRPLRFLALVIIGWICARIALLWPQTGSLPEAIRALAPDLVATERPAAPVLSPVVRPMAKPSAHAPKPRIHLRISASPPAFAARPFTAALAYPAEPDLVDPPGATVTSPIPPTGDPPADRWSASGWFTARPGSAPGAAPGGQLGGSQTGLRIAYRLPSRERLAAFARFTTPLKGQGREVAAGLEWQPAKAPVRLVVVHRFGLDGAPGGPEIGLVAGMEAKVAGFRLEAYGQAGAIERRRTEPYADGAARLTRPLGRFSLGAGMWGAAQRDAQRLDVGPTVTLKLGPTRISLDWRQRIAGAARPDSGPALTLGGDF